MIELFKDSNINLFFQIFKNNYHNLALFLLFKKIKFEIKFKDI